MSCEWLMKVSLLMDGELTAGDANEVQAHISICEECCSSYNEYLNMRNKMRSYSADLNIIRQQRALNSILGAKKESIWGRRVSLSAPVFTLIILVTFIIGITSILIISRENNQRSEQTSEHSVTEGKTFPGSSIVSDLSRFDRGERATIQIVKKRVQLNSLEKQ